MDNIVSVGFLTGVAILAEIYCKILFVISFSLNTSYCTLKTLLGTKSTKCNYTKHIDPILIVPFGQCSTKK